MSVEYSLARAVDSYYLPGIGDTGLFSLWLRPAGRDFEESDLAQLLRAFEPLRPALWHASGKRFPSRLPGDRTSFGLWPELPGLTISLTEIEYGGDECKVQARAAWLAKGGIRVLPSFLRGSSMACRGVVALVPDSPEASQNWANFVQGALWLWLCHRWVGSAPRAPIDTEGVALRYLALTSEIGGAAALTWVDSDMRTGLTFFGAEHFLRSVTEQLDYASGFAYADNLVAQLEGRGFGFALSV